MAKATMYQVKEIYYTLQGEGAHAGRPAVFCRFAGCNLWSGREADRATAICRFCDTDFVGTDGPGGGAFASPEDLAGAIAATWPGGGDAMVVFTGGEPALQLDAALTCALKSRGFFIAIETNGTIALDPGLRARLDWICMSPKAGTHIRQTSGHELKLVYPQVGAEPARFEALDFAEFRLQPMDGPHQAANIAAATAYCLAHPRWRLSLQTHKLIGLP